MSHIWMSHVTHMNASCHTYEFVTSRAYQWVMSHVRISHVTHIHTSCRIYERDTSHTHDCVPWHIRTHLHQRAAARRHGLICLFKKKIRFVSWLIVSFSTEVSIMMYTRQWIVNGHITENSLSDMIQKRQFIAIFLRQWIVKLIERNPPGWFPIYYVPSSRTVSKRTPLEAPDTNSSREVLLLTVLMREHSK